jgi:predicted phosphodiesterase
MTSQQYAPPTLPFALAIGLLVLAACAALVDGTKQDGQDPAGVAQAAARTHARHDPRPLMQELDGRATPAGPVPFQFVVFGDWHNNGLNEGIYRRIDETRPDFCLVLGDMVNRGSSQDDWDHLERIGGWFFEKHPCWAVAGNHETEGRRKKSDGPERFQAFWGTPVYEVFSFTYSNAKFIGLPEDYIASEDGLAKLEAEMASAAGKHVFVFGHFPYYSVGPRGTQATSDPARAVARIFAKYKPVAVFSGHEHIYYRTRRDGVNYVVLGCGGGHIQDLLHERDSMPGDVYYGRAADGTGYRFHNPAFKADVASKDPAYCFLCMTVEAGNVRLRLLDCADGREWDNAVLAGEDRGAPATPDIKGGGQ